MKKDLLLIFILSLPAVAWWFMAGRIIDGTDIIFPLNPVLNLHKSLYAWEPIYNTGSYLFAIQQNLVKVPLYAVFSLFTSLGFSLSIASKLFYFLFTLLPMLAMYFFIRELLSEKKGRSFPALVAAVFYVYNLYYTQQILDQAIILSYLFTPLILFFVLRAIKTKQIFLYSLLIGLSQILYTPVNPNSYAVGILVIVAFLLFLFIQSIVQKQKDTTVLIMKLTGLSVLFSVLCASYWLIPYIFYLQVNTSVIQGMAADWLNGVSKYTSFSNVIRLIGAWDWFEGWNGEPYAPYASFIVSSRYLMAFAYLPLLVVFSGFLVSKRGVKYFFAALAVVGVILAMGSHAPTGGVYLFLYKYLPLFWIFRSPWYKFSFFIAFSYAVLIGLFIEKVKEAKRAVWIITAVTVCLVTVAFPLFTGYRFIRPTDRRGNLAPLQVQIPRYVFQTADWINQQNTSTRVVMVPQVAWESTGYNWGYGNLLTPLNTLLQRNPVMLLPYDRTGPGVDLLKAYKLSLYNPDSTPSANFLEFLNAGYIVNQKDFWYYYFRAPDNPQLVSSYLNQESDIKKVTSIGEWDVYKSSTFLPKIYAAHSFVLVSNYDQVSKLNIHTYPAFTFGKNDTSKFNHLDLKAKVSFSQKSPVEYSVSVRTQKPTLVVFSEAFDKNWELSSTNNHLYPHVLVNGYANGYLVNSSGSDLKLYYKPQLYQNIGRYGTLFALFLLGILTVYKRNRHEK